MSATALIVDSFRDVPFRDPASKEQPKRGSWELLVMAAAIGILIRLASVAAGPAVIMMARLALRVH
jgi:hypothetical protein